MNQKQPRQIMVHEVIPGQKPVPIISLSEVQHLFKLDPTSTNGWRKYGLATFRVPGFSSSFVRLSDLRAFLKARASDPQARLPYDEFLALLP